MWDVATSTAIPGKGDFIYSSGLSGSTTNLREDFDNEWIEIRVRTAVSVAVKSIRNPGTVAKINPADSKTFLIPVLTVIQKVICSKMWLNSEMC